MSETDYFGGILGDGVVILDEGGFRREVRATLAHHLITNLDDDFLLDLFQICRDGLAVFGLSSRAKTSEFRRISRNAERLVDKFRSLTNQLRSEVQTAPSEVFGELDKKDLNLSIRNLFRVIDTADGRLRAFQSMAKTARREPYPGALSLSLDDFLRAYHRRKWNQQKRDMIIAACLQASRVYPRKHKFDDIVERVAMQRSRASRRYAGFEGRFVHQPHSARLRPTRLK